MPDNVGRVPIKRRDDADDVSGELLNPVGVNAPWLLTEAVATLIRGDHPVARLREGDHNPGHPAPKLREAMQGHREGAVLGTRDSAVQAHAIGEDIAMLHEHPIDPLALHGVRHRRHAMSLGGRFPAGDQPGVITWG